MPGVDDGRFFGIVVIGGPAEVDHLVAVVAVMSLVVKVVSCIDSRSGIGESVNSSGNRPQSVSYECAKKAH